MSVIHTKDIERVYRHAHMFCGIGAGAKGFNQANPRIGHMTARFECAGGIDSDAGAIREFRNQTGVAGTLMDLFDRPQYEAFHGKEPPADWKEASPADIFSVFGPHVDVAFTSAPCKGFSGLLSSSQSKTDKYQALNALTLRGIWLLLEAYKHDPISIILFENVPRIASRGRPLLDQIIALLRHYGYHVNEDTHNCGEIGNLAQSRNRFLLIARHPEKVPPFVYQPPKFKLRGVGEVIGKLPLPGDPVAGIMHRVPSLHWQTWVRLALVPAGKDWRALNDLTVEAGVLRDYGIVPEVPLRDNALGVNAWDDTAPLVTGQRAPGQGRFSVADPRPADPLYRTALGVTDWEEEAGTIGGRGFPLNGAYSVADPRPADAAWNDDVLGVREWNDKTGTVTSRSAPSNGAYSVADPRIDGHPKSVQLGVRPWNKPGACVKGDMSVGGGPYAVADPRLEGRPRFNNTFRVVPYGEASPAVAGPGGPAGGLAVADPRAPSSPTFKKNKYKVTAFTDPAGSVIGASTTGDGAFAVADPRGGDDADKLHGKYRIEDWNDPSRAVIAGRDNGAFAVADPRCTWGNGSHQNKLRVTPYDEPAGAVIGTDRVGSGAPIVADQRRENYQTGGHYGVVPWEGAAYTVAASASHDNGFNSVADPRDATLSPAQPIILPGPTDRLVCRIIALDGTWHRPFTTLDLASLQSIIDPEEVFYQDPDGAWKARHGFEIETTSDATRREWIGNAVPSAAAKAMANTIGETLLLAYTGETFMLSTREIWVKPLALALTVDNDQVAFRMERGIA
jgi:site-specific DNA-cytosine methylase